MHPPHYLSLGKSKESAFFTGLHGHQSKTFSLFVEGAIAANSLVIQRVAEALLAGSSVNVCSIERRLERFLSNPRIDTHKTWDEFLSQVMPFFRREPMRLVIDLTSSEEHAQVITLGSYSHRVGCHWCGRSCLETRSGIKDGGSVLSSCSTAWLPILVPRTVPSSEIVPLGAFPSMVSLCHQYRWHYLFRSCAQHTWKPRSSQGPLQAACAVSDLVNERGLALLWAGSPLARRYD